MCKECRDQNAFRRAEASPGSVFRIEHSERALLNLRPLPHGHKSLRPGNAMDVAALPFRRVGLRELVNTLV